MQPTSVQILLLRLIIGVLFLFEGFGKINEGWLMSSEPLVQRLNTFHQKAGEPQRSYLEAVALHSSNGTTCSTR